MIFIKIFLHLKALIEYVFYKLIYGNRFKVGKSTTWRNNFSVMIAKTARVEIGDNCFFNNGCSLNANQFISIGEGTLLGENVKIYDHNHKFRDRDKSIKEQGFKNGEITIGKHCWIGSNVVILKGSKIGDNCVIGAGCVVSGIVKGKNIVKNINRLEYLKIDD